ncbi:hypothetical protein ISN44_As07g023610 [Arabidopsis suecica]|uniref:Reverse transcriptase domain-containing protein n=1 Tax=Arabidopsis suecica TaxID=45249 RepID=A0A8T2C3U2_ARASU|nr:hypothetical protein ISN44_As07g023610 [Arabidopsis suecica]
MSSAMDAALMAMSLLEVEVPFDMPDLPEYSSCERNVLSLVGRTLNPDCQPMDHLIRAMPRKWQKIGRVRGVALSKERFQFFFNSEHDLVEVLEKGVHTFNEWTIVVDRWYENPPDNYLQFTPLWIQLWNLPINFYTEKALMLLGEQIGQVKEVAFDTEKPQLQDFVRVKVIFDVSRPLRRAKVVNLPKGGSTSVYYEYERVQKRCYECQRMTHDKDHCPLLIKKRQDQADARRAGNHVPKAKPTPVLSEADPLFGVLNENQVGLDPATGRPRIAPEVLEGMRQYLRVSSDEERLLRIDKVKISVGEVEKDPFAQKSILRLEPLPIFHQNLDKEKGIVFNYEKGFSGGKSDLELIAGSSYLESSPTWGSNRMCLEDASSSFSADAPGRFLALSQPFQDNSTVFGPSSFVAGSSGIGLVQAKNNNRKRPTKSNRKSKPKVPNLQGTSVEKKKDSLKNNKEKRKAVDVGPSAGKLAKLNPQEEMRKKHFPEILFLMETMHKRDVLVDLQVWLGYDQVYTVEPIGKCGGLALFWKSSVKVDLQFVDKNLLDAQVQFGANNFFLSCVYGDPDRSKRNDVWERITRIGIGRRDRWCLVGDFNDLLHNGEKVGGPRRSDNDFKGFNEMIRICDMSEMPSTGNKLTWAGRRGDHWIQCRLDRAFGNSEWFSSFPVSNQAFLDLRGSDHRPVLIKLISSQEAYRGQFRFDKRLLHKEEVKLTIAKSWNQGRNGILVSVADRMRECRRSLSKWKKQNTLNSLDRIHQLEVALEKEQSEVWPGFQKVAVLKRNLAKAYREEEAYWKQKSRQKWLRSGNRNSKYFHAAVKENRQRKRIEKLKDINGNFQVSEAAKGEVAAAYFQNLFTSSNPESFGSWFDGLSPRVSDSLNSDLIAEVSVQEIKEAFFSIKPASAPGPDGMSAMFFQHYWSIVGPQVTTEVQKFFVEGFMPSEWNYTHLCLIPKTNHPTEMINLRPISLCSVLYKVISKILVKRLQPILPEIVSNTQSAFVSERLITDNILVAHELVHSLKVHPRMSSEFMAVKSDMSKAYDRVEWSYLRSLLLALGFHIKWVNWIMICVSTVTYSVLINDCPYGLINPQRGLRQGDPLSPFLFVLCTEGLTHLLNMAQREGVLEGMQFADSGPVVHHLLFADDSLFLCKASLEQSLVLQKILRIYGNATGQTINLNKSSITFGDKIDEPTKVSIQSCLGILAEGGAGTYLGLPECFSGSKIDMLNYLKDRLKAKLSGWFNRCLSQGGKEVLLKSVALAMPVFAMSCFKLPKTTCDNLESAMASFWWSAAEHSRKIHWQSWERLCLPKDCGGLGFRDIQSFNQALLAKQAWRILQTPDCLLSRLMKSRYFVESNFLEAPMSQRPSFAWRSILFGRDLLVKGLVKKVGNGESIRVWRDSWIDDNGYRAPWRKNGFFQVDLKVSALIDGRTGFWNSEMLDDLFLPQDIQTIKAIKPLVSQEDFYIWSHNKSGDFSVKSAYWVADLAKSAAIRNEACVQPSTNELKKLVWKTQTDPKIKIFLWKILSGVLPVAENLNTRGLNVDVTCQVCGELGESTNHTLFLCPLARQIWALSDYPAPSFGFHNGSIFSNVYHLLENRDNKDWPVNLRKSFPWILWRIWTNRNSLNFEGRIFSALETVGKIRDDVLEWFEAQVVEKEEDAALNAQSCHIQSGGVVSAKTWSKPLNSWLKCNVGSVWSKRNLCAGGAWVLRDERGKVLFHSRRSFANILCKSDAVLRCVLWAMESMKSHRVDKIIFSFQDKTLVDAVNRPRAWPSFKAQSMALIMSLRYFVEWKVEVEVAAANRGANLIAQSVTEDSRCQSYVASGPPTWLSRVFSDEEGLSPV